MRTGATAVSLPPAGSGVNKPLQRESLVPEGIGISIEGELQ